MIPFRYMPEKAKVNGLPGTRSDYKGHGNFRTMGMLCVMVVAIQECFVQPGT